jgi:hypothetical protein
MRFLVITAMVMQVATPVVAQMRVIDNANLGVANRTAETTDKILETNREVRTTVEDTLKAVTGDRAGVASALQRLAVGNGFSVSQLPGLDKILSAGGTDFGSVDGAVSGTATNFLNGLKLLQNLSGQKQSTLSSDKSYEELMKTVLAVATLTTGAQQAVTARRGALEQAGSMIGKAEDVKGSLDQNTQLQVQSGLTINELIGVMNGVAQSLQAQNQRRLTDMSNSKKALTYKE